MTAEPIEDWRRVWRLGFAPALSRESLEALRDALRADDERLIQGSTTAPPPLLCVQDWPVEAGCLLGYCGAVACGGFGVAAVGDVEDFFCRACHDADGRLGRPGECRHLLNYWDHTPRADAVANMLAEVELALMGRG